FYANLVKEVLKYGMESILRGFAFQRDQVIDTHFVSEVRNYLPLNPGHYFDLAAIGIQRGRDLCIPDYATVRRFLNMTEALLWSDITSDMDVQRILSELYDDINDVDSYAAVFAEDKVDANSLVGPMQRWSIREQFQRLRDGDRFWYENPGILSEFEMDALANMTLGELVMRNTNISWYPADPFVAVDASTKFVQKESPQPATSVVNQVNALGMLSLMWTIRLAEGAIDFRFESNSTGWFGFGFGKNMIDADILFVNDDGTGMYTVQDSWSTSTQPIVSDVAQGGVNNVLNGMDITASQSFSKRVVTFSRLLNTGDPFDTVIVNGYSAYILGLVAGYYGVVDITTGTAYNAYLPYAYIVSVLITPIVAVIYGQLILLKKKRDNQKISMADMLSLPLFTWDDINQRVASGSKWLVIESIIYDTENYLKSHPGGQAAILRMIGLDASGAFLGLESDSEKSFSVSSEDAAGPQISQEKSQTRSNSRGAVEHRHTRFAKFILAGLAVGRLREESEDAGMLSAKSLPVSFSMSNSKFDYIDIEKLKLAKYGPSTEKFTEFFLEKKVVLENGNSKTPIYVFRFAFKHSETEVLVKLGNCFLLQYIDEETGKIVTRSYWPLHCHNKGGVEFLIRIVDGEMTRYLASSQAIRIRGPIPHCEVANHYSETGVWRTLGIITEGIALTAGIPVIDYHLRYCKRDAVSGRPQCQIHLLACFSDESDLFAQKELGLLESAALGAVVVTFLLATSASHTYTGLVGVVSKETILATMPKAETAANRNSESRRSPSIIADGTFSPSTRNALSLNHAFREDGLVRRKNSVESTESKRYRQMEEISVRYSRVPQLEGLSDSGDENDVGIAICGYEAYITMPTNLIVIFPKRSLEFYDTIRTILEELGYKKVFHISS
ncbi:hypothetical protein HDU82_002318, partial [Entophlyctis luteolus]